MVAVILPSSYSSPVQGGFTKAGVYSECSCFRSHAVGDAKGPSPGNLVPQAEVARSWQFSSPNHVPSTTLALFSLHALETYVLCSKVLSGRYMGESGQKLLNQPGVIAIATNAFFSVLSRFE